MRIVAVIAAALFGGCALTIAALTPIVSGVHAAETVAVDPVNLLVMDGDTIRVKGIKPSIRLTGYTSPATKATCTSERQLGSKAKARLYDLVRSGPVTLELVPCACPPGTEGTGLCNYGRACGILTVGGVDVGKTLISERLAVPHVCGATSCPTLSNLWCESPAGKSRT